jgi:hypothetical protein
MAYIGNTPASNFASVTKDTFSGDGSTTAFTLSKTATTNGVAVFVENVRQEPTTAYAVSGTTLTFTAAPVSASGNNIYVLHHNTPASTATHPASQDLTAVNGTMTGTLAVTGTSTLTGATTVGGTSNLTIADGNLVVGTSGHGIDFSAETGDGPSVTSELLDSYEEGHIGTIGISVSGSDVVDSANSNKYYIKVGRVVHLYFHIVLDGTMPAGTYSLTGMPFTSSNSNPAHRGAGVANAQDASSSYGQDGNYVSVRTNENSTSLTIYVPVQYVSEDRINLYASYITAS